MSYTALAAKVYKGAITTQWGNSIKEDFDEIHLIRACQGFIHFDGSAASLSAKDSFNVGAILDLGAAGEYRLTWSNDFTSSAYIIVGAGVNTAGGSWPSIHLVPKSGASTPMTSGTVEVKFINNSNAGDDPDIAMVAAFGRLVS